MDARERLRSNRFEETLPSGLRVTIRPPRIRDCILAGHVPLPILSKLAGLAAASNGQQVEVSTEEAEHMARFQDEVVRRSVVAIEDEPIELTVEDLADFAQEDYDRIVELGTRERTSPLASTPT